MEGFFGGGVQVIVLYPDYGGSYMNIYICVLKFI